MSNRNKTGRMNIKPGKVSYKILQWMQEHEGTSTLKRTTGHLVAARIAALDDVENGELTIEQTFSRMVKCNVIYRDKHDKSSYSDYRINYWHKSIPADILANAPVEVKRAMAKTIDDMKPEQYMDEQGCVVTPGAVEKTEDPFNEDKDLLLPEETIEEICNEPVKPYEEKPTTQEVSVPLEIKKDGKSMSITVNLTINL